MLVRFIEERGWMVFNGKVKGDEEGIHIYEREGMYGDRFCVRLGMGDREVKDRVERLRVGDRAESDHQHVEVCVKVERERRG